MFQESTFEGLKSFRESFVNTYKWRFYFTSTLLRLLHASWFEKKQQHFRLEKWKKKSPKQSIVQIGKFLILLLVVDYDLGRSDKGKTENQVVPALLCWKYAKRNCIVIFFWNYAYVILFVKLKLWY